MVKYKRPLFTYPGGKYRFLSNIIPLVPKCKRFIDVFAGGLSVSINVDRDEHIINDIESELINVYRFIKDDKDRYIDAIKPLFSEEYNTREMFLNVRQRYNKSTDLFEKATLLLYLNKNTYRGMLRYNSKGEFNTAPKITKNTKSIDKLIFDINNTHELLKKSELFSLDYSEIFNMIRPGDVVYCDPPYLNEDNSVYRNKFGYQQHVKLRDLAVNSNQTVIISNAYNEKTLDLYKDANIFVIDGKWSFCPTGTSTQKEIVAIFNQQFSYTL